MSKEERHLYYARFNVDGLLRGDYASRMQGYAVGRQNGWLSANDIRELEDLNPIEGGDIYLVNGNMTQADAKIASQTAPITPQGAKGGGASNEPTGNAPQTVTTSKKKNKQKKEDNVKE